MSSNVYTKNDILNELSQKGFFIDTYTLDTFFKIWKIDVLYEDKDGNEFYDKNAMGLVLEKLFNKEAPKDDTPIPVFDKKLKNQEQETDTDTELQVETPTSEENMAPMPSEEIKIKKEDNDMTTPDSIETKESTEFTDTDEIKFEEVPDISIKDEPIEPKANVQEEEEVDFIRPASFSQLDEPKKEDITMPSESAENATVDYSQDETDEIKKEPEEQIDLISPQSEKIEPENQINVIPDDNEANELLNNIKLSDGSILAQKVQQTLNGETVDIVEPEPKVEQAEPKVDEPKAETPDIIDDSSQDNLVFAQEAPPSLQDAQVDSSAKDENEHSDEDFDDLTLLTESFEAQEKFRDYIVQELSKKNVDLTPQQAAAQNEETEQLLEKFAQSIAQKITSQVSEFCANDTMFSAKMNEMKEKIHRLELKNKELEKQNKKLRLLLVESNKNLNSYKPTYFGLYKKEKPTKTKG